LASAVLVVVRKGAASWAASCQAGAQVIALCDVAQKNLDLARAQVNQVSEQ
jgi:hypothetical protein